MSSSFLPQPCFLKALELPLMETSKNKPHVVILPSRGAGHLNPMLQFLDHLLSYKKFSITLITHSGEKITDKMHTSDFSVLTLPPVSTADLPQETKIVTSVSVINHRSLEPLKQLLTTILPISVIVLDLFWTDAFDFVEELGVPAYLFYMSAAANFLFSFNIPVLDEEITGEYLDLKEPIRINGCPAFKPIELADPMLDRKNQAYKYMLQHCKRFHKAQGVIINSFHELEPDAIDAMQRKLPENTYGAKLPEIFAIGPLIKTSPAADQNKNSCLSWLDNQPSNSVLFVCFGSGGTMSEQQLIELAFGLEMSNERFLWVARPPQKIKSGAYFGTRDSDLGFLPEGFIERTKERGMVVHGWAPQEAVLRHGAVKAFLSHCGWNSSVESVTFGVAIIGWPMYAEQRMCARVLSDVGVAVVVDCYEVEVVGREEVERVVRLMMVEECGKKMREKAKELSLAAKKAMKEGCGSSSRTLAKLVDRMLPS